MTPGQARAGFNIRFNDLHTPDSLMQRIGEIAAAVKREKGGEIAILRSVSGVSFITQPGEYTALLSEAVVRVTGAAPQLSTTGGTSDARFIRDHCPVAELGLPGGTMHKTDEHVMLADLVDLTKIYRAIIGLYLGRN